MFLLQQRTPLGDVLCETVDPNDNGMTFTYIAVRPYGHHDELGTIHTSPAIAMKLQRRIRSGGALFLFNGLVQLGIELIFQLSL